MKHLLTILLFILMLAPCTFASVAPDTHFLGEWSPTVVYEFQDIVTVTGWPYYFEANDTHGLINLDKYPAVDGTVFWTHIQSLPTPEPSSLMLLGSGILSLFGLKRKKVA